MADSPALKPVYLLTGSDRPKIETALARLRRHFEPEAIEIVSAQERRAARPPPSATPAASSATRASSSSKASTGAATARAGSRTAGRPPT